MARPQYRSWNMINKQYSTYLPHYLDEELYKGAWAYHCYKIDYPNLVSQHEDRLHGEPSGAEVEEILERWSEQVHDKHVVVTLRAIPERKHNQYD